MTIELKYFLEQDVYYGIFDHQLNNQSIQAISLTKLVSLAEKIVKTEFGNRCILKVTQIRPR